jgi:hypothetical protein
VKEGAPFGFFLEEGVHYLFVGSFLERRSLLQRQGKRQGKFKGKQEQRQSKGS